MDFLSGAALWIDVEVQKQTGLPGIISEQRSADVVNIVVDRLLENLDDGSKQTMRLCAILRWFDEFDIRTSNATARSRRDL